jgi:hypothetical protein
MKKKLTFLLLLTFLIACSRKADKNAGIKQSDKAILMETDKSFSVLSEQKGMKKCFY